MPSNESVGALILLWKYNLVKPLIYLVRSIKVEDAQVLQCSNVNSGQDMQLQKLKTDAHKYQDTDKMSQQHYL